METKSKHTIADLEKLYAEAETCDQDVFAEMRSNLLLVAGEHYNKKVSAFFKRIRDSQELSEQQKLRLTKNHVQKICTIYSENILSRAPGVGMEPKNESELQDQKSAELHHAVWRDAVERYGLDEHTEDECDNFVQIGEAHTKVFYDPTAGKLKGHRQAIGEDGNLQYDELGQPVLGEPVYAGEWVFEQVHGFNLLRAPEAKILDKSPYLIIRKMVNAKDLIAKFPDAKKFIVESSDQTMVVFDPNRGGYRKSSGEVMLKEYYFRPCVDYPNGYFYFATKEGILHSDELPGGLFPIVSTPFKKIPTSPRGRSPIKTMRPYQAEINRSASKMAEHQITLGDDKVLIQNGTKISSGVALPGVRSINYTGMEPKILGGRDGSQYLAYMNSQIAELYDVMNVKEEMAETKDGQLDPYAMLFKSATQKRKFSRYVKRFERHLVKVAKLFLSLAKIQMPEDQIIEAIGRNEQVNITEFKNAKDIGYEVKVVEQSDDIETKMGRQLVLNHIVQYAGANLSKEDIGKLVRLMPYANGEQGFQDFTLEYDAATNDILALDRGELPPIAPYDDHPYMVKRLTAVTRQADFQFKDPVIQRNYKWKIAAHEQAEVIRQREIQRAQQGLIPTGGYLVSCDFYVQDPGDPAGIRTRRARFPYEALVWLQKQLEAQGQSLESLEQLNQGAVQEMARMFMRSGQALPDAGEISAPQPREAIPV